MRAQPGRDLPLDHPAQTARPDNFESTAELARALNDFEHRYNEIAQPFDWTFTREDLANLLARLDQRERDPPLALAA